MSAHDKVVDALAKHAESLVPDSRPIAYAYQRADAVAAALRDYQARALSTQCECCEAWRKRVTRAEREGEGCTTWAARDEDTPQWECACGLVNRGESCPRCQRVKAFTYHSDEEDGA
jgi:hypothetical protein